MSADAAARPLRLAYLMSRFPKATETFILYEILELQRLGHVVEIFPLVLERESVLQPGAAALVERAHDLRPWSRPVLAAQLHWLRRRPAAYVGSWVGAIRGTIRSPRFLLRALVAVPIGAAIARRVVDLDLDHIHAHWATHPTLAAWVAARLSGRPYSFTAHAHDIQVERAMLDEKIRSARFVVTISEANRRLLTGWYGAMAEAKTIVIHCGADPAVFAPPNGGDAGAADAHATDRGAPAGGSADADPAATAPPTRPGSLVCVASLQPQKGQRHLVEACGLLRDRGRAVRCTFVGEGEERAALEALIHALGLGDVVTLLGAQPRDRVVAIVEAADVFVQPSIVLRSGKTEGIPVALMEALAAERAAVASEVSGIPELVVDGVTGVLVPPGDAAALADAIERLLDDPALRARLGTAGRRKVLEEFDLHRNTALLAERFRQSVDRGHVEG
jgi:colanic acid/amylovoran biosynthesis glycosyltransferase